MVSRNVGIVNQFRFCLAQEVVVNAVAPTSDDYALSVVWSNLQAKSGSNNSLTVVDNGTVKGLRLLGKKRVDVSVHGAPHYLDAIAQKGKFKDDPEQLVNAYKNMSALFATTGYSSKHHHLIALLDFYSPQQLGFEKGKRA